MSLARAFTKRTKRPQDVAEPLPGRAASTRKPGQAINRNLISSPVQLISTTNMLSYNAPDLPTVSPALRHASSLSSTSSTSSSRKKSLDDSDLHSSSPELTDASSIESSSPRSPKPNHLSSYFSGAATEPFPSAIPLEPVTVPAPVSRPRRTVSTTSLQAKTLANESSPAVPQRARAHSKHAHEQIARQRSLHSMSSTPRGSQEYRASREQRASTEIFRAAVVEETHPFGKELEQLNEVVEEFGGVLAAADMDEDIIFMRHHGLSKFSATDYLSEIQPLFGGALAPNFGRRGLAKPIQPAAPAAAAASDSYGWI